MKIPINFSSHLKDISLLKENKIRSKIINYSWFNFFKNIVLYKINFIRSLNEKIYKDLLDLKFPENHILKIPNGISSKNFLGLSKNDHKNTYFGYVGRLIKFKNLIFLLQVFRLYSLKYPHDRLFFYGKGSEGRIILKFIRKNNLTKNIFLCGFVKDKKKIYSNIDVIIDPALAQGISNAMLEAMCTNTFVIASNVDGNKDLIDNGKTGLLFNPYNKKDLLKQLLYYKENKEIVQQILNNAKNEILLNYDIDIITNKIYRFLKSKL